MRYLCSRVAVIYAGKIVEELPVAVLAATSSYTQALLAAEAQLFAPSKCICLKGAARSGSLSGRVPFHPRCPIRMKRCKKAPADNSEVGHRAACLRD